MYVKIRILKKQQIEKYNYSNIYNIEQNSSYERIIIGLGQGHINTVLELMAVFSEPFYILYVLHTPHTDNEVGRYQSKLLTYDEVGAILNRFKDFFENAPRHDLWMTSLEINTIIVYDRHNRIYIYGFTGKHIYIINKWV